MARVPWGIIKLCLPCWLIESAPYKQAFTLSLIILIPPLLISPFLLSPLLILLLLTSATVVGALSAWISVKASRIVLKHTIPLNLPLSFNSCLQLFAKAVLAYIVRSFPVISSLPWAWFLHAKTLIEPEGSREDGESAEIKTSSVPSDDVASAGRIPTGQIDSPSWQSENLGGGDHAAIKKATVGGAKLGYAAAFKKEEMVGFGLEEIKTATVGDIASRLENLEKVTFTDVGEEVIGSAATKGRNVCLRRNIVHFSRGLNDHQPCIEERFGVAKRDSKGNSIAEILESRNGSQDRCVADASEILSTAADDSLKEDCPSRTSSAIGNQNLKRKPVSEVGLVHSIIATNSTDHSCYLGPREVVGQTKHSQGCSSHSWCQRGVNLEEELVLLADDIHLECLENWYPSLSENEEFPLEFKVLLDMFFKRAASLGESANISSLSLKLGSLFLCHLREYRKSRRKKRAAEPLVQEARKRGDSQTKLLEPSENFPEREENAVNGDGSHQCATVASECGSNNLAVREDGCKNLVEGSPRPSNIFPRESPGSALTYVKTSPEAPLGEEAYYRLRFGSSARKKNVHAHYLMNVVMLVVKDFVCAVGKLPIEPEVKQYFKEFGSSLAESSPGKILVSMISRKVFLPLVDTISDPQWLNARVASLLIDHVGAKVSLDSLREEEDFISYFSTPASSVVSVRGGHGAGTSVDRSFIGAVIFEKCDEVCVKNEENSSREERRKSLSLPLEVSSNSSITNPIDGRISSVLGGIISTTAGPLLPDNVGISYKPINRMWSSPSVDESQEFEGEPEYKKKVRQFGRHIVDGLPVYSSALSGRAALGTAQGGLSSDSGQQGIHTSSSVTKTLHESIQRKSNSSPAIKKPTKKKFLGLPLSTKQSAEVTPHGGLFRSKSSHDVQATNVGNWLVEEGSELHEGAYLSDDSASPMDGSKEDRDCFSRKSARCRSFHGMNYSRQRETLRARFAQKQECLRRGIEQKGMVAGADQDDGGIVLRYSSKSERLSSLASSEEHFGEENDKVFDDDVVELGKGLSTRWVKHSSGSSVDPGCLEVYQNQTVEAGSSSLLVKGGRIVAGSRGKSLSDGDEVPDPSKKDKSHHSTREASGGTVASEAMDRISLMDLDSVKRSDEFLQSSPLPGVENDSMNEIVKDISPVYEEVADLPSTVAKLKAFLKERNGSQKSEESAPSSAEGEIMELDSSAREFNLHFEQQTPEKAETERADGETDYHCSSQREEGEPAASNMFGTSLPKPRPGCSHWQEVEIEYSIANPPALEKDSGVVHSRSQGHLENISQSEGKKEFDSLSSLELSLEQDASLLPKPPASPLEERPFSWPSDGGIFLNVRIPYTEICKGNTSSQSSNPLLQNYPHVFYCIEYDAAYPEEGADAAVVGLSGADMDGQFTGGNSSVLHGEDYKKSIENSESSEAVLPSPGTIINHIVVKRQFQEFLDLHAQLESDPLWRDALKGLKGPTRWLNLPFGKASASTVAGRRTLLQAYLRGVCTSMPQLASRSKALRTFMAYQGMSKDLSSGEALPLSVERVLPITAEGGDGPVPRIDKFFARTVSGMFNTLKTALPGFDSQESTQQPSDTHASASSTPLPPSMVPSHLDPSSAPAALGETKTTFGHPGTIKGTMMQLPAFLQFGSSNVVTYPDLVDWDMDYSERDSGGFNSMSSIEGIPVKTLSLEEDVLAFLEQFGKSPTSKEGAEFAFEALDPIDSFEDGIDTHDQTAPKRNGSQYLVDSGDEDGEEEELDAFLPLCKLAINILCEALRGTGSWVSQGTVVHASKVIFGSFVEEKLQEFLKSVTSKEMWCHYVHTLRVVLFHPPPVGLNQSGSKENRSISEQQLATAIFTAFPLSLRQVIGNQELLEAAKFIAESLQNKVILRELVLQVLHICVTHLISSGSQRAVEN